MTNASKVGLRGVLVQKQGSEYRVIMYASRSLSDLERRYSQTEKGIGNRLGCERFHMYLIGFKFELWTDHRPLECIFSPRSKPSARIERWVLRLQSFDYVVKYISGKRNIADSLSRLLSRPTENSSEQNGIEDYEHSIALAATPIALFTKEIERASETDEELCDVRRCLLSGQWERSKFKEYLPVKNELCAIGQVILRGTRIVIPRSLRTRVLELGHE